MLVLVLDTPCTFFGHPKKVPKTSAAVSTQRTHDQGLLAPWNPDSVGRGRACLKNRQDTFFDAPPTRSRLTAPPKNSPPGRGGVCPARDQMEMKNLRVNLKGRHICRPLQPHRYCNITGKRHGTHLCVPYKPAGNTAPSRPTSPYNKKICPLARTHRILTLNS